MWELPREGHGWEGRQGKGIFEDVRDFSMSLADWKEPGEEVLGSRDSGQGQFLGRREGGISL